MSGWKNCTSPPAMNVTSLPRIRITGTMYSSVFSGVNAFRAILGQLEPVSACLQFNDRVTLTRRDVDLYTPWSLRRALS